MTKAAARFYVSGLARIRCGLWFHCIVGLCTPILAVVPLSAGQPTPASHAYSARTWQVDDGLPENRVVGVIQSSDGYIWAATQGGLVRFDGSRFQRVDLAQTPGTVAGTMRVLLLDRQGRIWLAKEEGGKVFCFEGAQVRSLSPEDQGLPVNEAQRSMAVDGEGGLWVSYTSGKLICRHPDGRMESFTAREGLPAGGGVCWLASGNDGILWFAKGSRVGILRNGRFSVLNDFGSSALQLAPARSGGVWICVDQRILRLEEGSEIRELGKIIPVEVRDRTSFEPTVLLEDRSGAVWVGTVSSGLYRCDSNATARVEVSNPGVLSLAEDHEANLWVGTRGGGLVRLHRRVTSLMNAAAGLPFEGVQSVCQDTSGALWAVGDNGLLARQQMGKWSVLTPGEGSARAYVTCATADTNGSVWVGTRGGALYHWADGQFTDLGLRSSLQEKSVRSLQTMRNGDLWVATDASDVLYRLRGNQPKPFALPPGRRFIRAMTEDNAGRFWAGASDGLLVCVAGDTLTDETALSASLSIRGLLGAASGDVWIGYAGAGVGRFRDGEITRFTTDQGLPNDYVSQILEDAQGCLWFAGNQGVFQVRASDFNSVAGGAASRVGALLYGRSKGAPGLQASFDYWPSSWHTRDQRLVFSTLSGLAEVRLENAQLNSRPPAVFIERVSADDRTFAVYQHFRAAGTTNMASLLELCQRSGQSELRLPPGRQHVQFEFTALSFVAPENVQFRYQLEGLDENWVDAGTRRVASYTHVPPGRYRFKVVASNSDGNWNNEGDTLTVTFEPYFWETAWFRVTLTVVSSGVLGGSLVLILRRRHRLVVERLEHQRALEEERTRIARDLHDDLGVGLTEIGLLGDLAGSGSGMPEAGRERLQEITGKARDLAASLDEIVWAINPANDVSQSLVDYFFSYAQKLLGRAGIRCRLEVIEPLPRGNLNAQKRHEFFHAFKEALNNVIRHSGATEVRVGMSAAGPNLQMCITDNGRGMRESGGTGAHHGLAGMRERLLRLGGRCEIISAASGGTTVTFVVPVEPGVQA